MNLKKTFSQNQIVSSFLSVLLLVSFFTPVNFLEGAKYLHSAKDPNHNLSLVWVQSPSGIATTYQILQSIQLSGSNEWGIPLVISNPAINTSSRIKLKCDELGNMTVAWIGMDPRYPFRSIYANTYDVVTKEWSGTVLISSHEQNLSNTFTLTINPKGSEIVWQAYDDEFNNNIYSCLYSNDKGWGPILQVTLLPSPLIGVIKTLLK